MGKALALFVNRCPSYALIYISAPFVLPLSLLVAYVDSLFTLGIKPTDKSTHLCNNSQMCRDAWFNNTAHHHEQAVVF